MQAEVITQTTPLQPDQPVKMAAHSRVYEQLRVMILFGELSPGQAVTIQGLTDTLGAGMTPVREALRRLIAAGALIHQGNRRVSVPVLTVDGAQELCFMRKALEPELTRRAALVMDKSRFGALKACDDKLNTAISRGDVGGYLTHNYRFHAMIYATADAPIMAETVDRLWLRFGPSLRVVCGRFGTNNLPDKHKDLLDALTAGDAAAAAHAMAQDVEQGMDQVCAAL